MNSKLEEYTFGTDYHQEAPNEIKIGNDVNIMSKKTYFLGDIFDYMNCRKDRVSIVKEKILSFMKLMGDRYITDNHDAIDGLIGKPRLIPGTRTLVLGGAEIFWGEDRLKNYIQKSPGAGFFKRQLWVRALMIVSNFVSDKISDEAFTRACALAIEYDADEVICGHKHPKKVLERSIEGIALKVLPRGTTKLMVKFYE